MPKFAYFDGCKPVRFGEYYCHPRLVEVSKMVTVEVRDGKEKVLHQRPEVDRDKLAGKVLAYDKQAVTDYCKWLKTATTKEIQELKTPFEVNFFVPIDNYQAWYHGNMTLLTASSDPGMVYPETLKLMSMHNCSTTATATRAAGSVPPLKGVKTLKLAGVSNSLDFTHTNVDKLIIDEIKLDGNPDHLDDYSEVFPLLDFLDTHWIPRHPACVISCNGTIQVNRSAPSRCWVGEKAMGKRPVDCLTYNCDTLIINRGEFGFTSSCRELHQQPDIKFTVAHYDKQSRVEFITPNLRKIVLLTEDDVDNTDDDSDEDSDDDSDDSSNEDND